MYKTLVINLDKDTDRMLFMSAQLKKLGIEYQRIPAVYGATYNYTQEEYNEAKAIREGGHALLPGELGCALSHILCYKEAEKEELDFALILEDDVSLPDNFKEIIQNEIEKNKDSKSWDYLLFDYVPVGIPFLRQWFNGVKKNFNNKNNLLEKIKFIFFHLLKACYIVPLSFFEGARDKYKKNNPGPVKFFRPVYFAGAYIVTKFGVKKLLSLTKPVVYTADHLPNRARVESGLKFRCYSPLIVKQEKEIFGSSILDLEGGKL